MGFSLLHKKHSLKALIALASVVIGATFFSFVFANSYDLSAPTKPTGLIIYLVSSSEIKLRWAASSDDVGVVGYKIYRGGNPMLEIGGALTPNFIDTTMTPGTGYYYSVAAYDATGRVSFSSAEIFVNVPLVAVVKPNAPVLSGSAGTDSATLNWTESSSGVTGFKVFKMIGGLPTDIGNVNGGPTTFTDSGLSAGSYTYKVQAFVQEGLSTPTYSDVSNTVVITVGGSSGPTALTATPRSSSQIDLSFSIISDAVSYKIFRGAGAASTVFLTSVTTNSFSDTGLSPSTRYYYAVKSSDAAGNESPLSVTVYETTAAPATPTATSSSGTTAPVISFVDARNIMGAGAQIFWTTDDPSDSRVYFGTSPSSATFYSRNSNSRCDGGGNVTNHCINLAELLSGTTYYYRVVSRNNDGLETISAPERSFMSQLVAAETATTTAPFPSVVNVSVTKGTAFCEGQSASTPVTFYSSWPSGVRFSVTKTGATTLETVNPGTRTLPNGYYSWQAYANTGYSLSGVTSGSLMLDKVCTISAVATTTSTVTPVVTLAASVALVGDVVVRVPYGGSFVDPGAKGYLNGVEVNPARNIGVYKSTVPGTYVIRYEIKGEGGVLLASAKRTVIVDDKLVSTSTATVPTLGIPPPPPEPLSVPSVTTPTTAPVALLPPPVVTEIPAQSVTEIASPMQYKNYCDDPVHERECRTYAATRITTERTATFEIPSTPGGASVIGKVFSGGEQQNIAVPGGATNESQLKSVCSQSEFAPACSEFLVNLKLSTREDADRRLREFLAAKAEAEKVITERVGARIFRDSDIDGITDYDEINLYATNPNEKDSNLNGVSDGDELLAGTDPSAPISTPQSATSSTSGTSTIFSLFVSGSDATTTVGHRINFENPKLAGDKKPDLLVVTVVRAVPLAQENGSTTKTALFLSGRALPNSFVTLFIYSEPIVVTVKTNDAGEWTYTMDKELADGSHEVYSAITDAGGRILAKSEPLPFTKVAAAVSLGEVLLPSPVVAPGFFSGSSLYMMVGVLVVVLAGSLSLIGLIVRRRETSHSGAGTEGEGNNLFP